MQRCTPLRDSDLWRSQPNLGRLIRLGAVYLMARVMRSPELCIMRLTIPGEILTI